MSTTPLRQGVDVTQNLTFRIIALASSLSRSAAVSIPEEVGISVAQWRVISVIGSRPGISFGAVVNILEIDKGWISRTLSALQKEGIVVATPDPMDKRQFTLKLTASGRALHLKGSRISRRRQQQLEAAFTPEEYRQLDTLLLRLQHAAETLD